MARRAPDPIFGHLPVRDIEIGYTVPEIKEMVETGLVGMIIQNGGPITTSDLLGTIFTYFYFGVTDWGTAATRPFRSDLLKALTDVRSRLFRDENRDVKWLYTIGQKDAQILCPFCLMTRDQIRDKGTEYITKGAGFTTHGNKLLAEAETHRILRRGAKIPDPVK